MAETSKSLQQYKEWYAAKKPLYEMLSEKVKEIIVDLCRLENINYQNIICRTKTIDSFIAKIEKNLGFIPEQMQDLAGIRVVASVNSDVEKISNLIKKVFIIDEKRSIDKGKMLGRNKVGYKSIHFVAQLPEERIKLPENQQFRNLYFEVQIRTILQDAWAQVGHDKSYKYSGVLPPEIERRFSLLSGLLEIADNDFDQISKEIDNYQKSVLEKTKIGNLDIPINSTSLREYLKGLFGDISRVNSVFGPLDNMADTIVEELKIMGLEKLSDLEKIIRKDYKQILVDFLEENNTKSNFCGVVRDILIIHDVDMYFGKAWRREWRIISLEKRDILSKFGINLEDIISKYSLVEAKPKKDGLTIR